MKKIILPILALNLINVYPAYADSEAWTFFENKYNLIEKNEITPRVNLRVFTGVLSNTRSKGIGDIVFRLGPTIDLTPWLNLSIHGVVMTDRTAKGEFLQELRGEFEPTLFTKIGDFSISDRNRLEFRSRSTGNMLWYRNLLKVSYNPSDFVVTPFAFNEIFVDTLNPSIIQNRATAGFAFKLNKNTKLELGYMLRNRYIVSSTKWENDNVLFFNLQSDFTKI